LASGRHSSGYVLLPRLVARPDRLRPWIAAIAGWARHLAPSVVVGPAFGGVIPAWSLAELLGPPVWAAFAEKEPDGTMAVRRGFPLGPGDRVLLVEDVLTTGGSLARAEAAVVAKGAAVVGRACLVDRRPDPAAPPPVFAVARLELPAWEPEACPLCLAGEEPPTRPKGL
jgi:orotate phosphoribosyltransferase